MAPAKLVPVAEKVHDPASYEQEHVHRVYDEIASHFSSTRYKPWPVVASFLESLPTGWVGLDSGTGNGKYLPLPQDRPGQTWTIGFDRSINLLKIARHAGANQFAREVVLGDVQDHCWRPACFDYAISIATIHHLSTPLRRKEAVISLLQSLSPEHGRGLIYVWATEQDDLSKRALPKTSDELQNAEKAGQDVFVPWQLSEQPVSKSLKRNSSQNGGKQVEHSNENNGQFNIQETAVYNRYYHMFERGELRGLVLSAANELGMVERQYQHTEENTNGSRVFVDIVQDDWERSNYYVELRLWKG